MPTSHHLAARLHPGMGFHWRDLCLLNLSTLSDGEHWIAVRYGYAIAIPPVMPLIAEGTFAGLVDRLASITRQQAEDGTY